VIKSLNSRVVLRELLGGVERGPCAAGVSEDSGVSDGGGDLGLGLNELKG